MRTRLLVFGLSALFLVQSPPAGADIVGGQPATKPYRFMVSLQTPWEGDEPSHLCGGTLVRRQWVLTAAHCVSETQPSEWRVMLGSHSLSSPDVFIGVARIIVHEQYPSTADYDVALLRLAKKAPFRPTRVPTPGEKDIWEPGTTATALGWGVDDFLSGERQDELQEVEVPVVSDADCARSYTGQGFNPETMVCAGEFEGGRDTCQGDSGGPLLVPDQKGKLVVMGVTSWGLGCAYPLFYGVYSRAGDMTLYGWIDAHLP